MDILKNFVVFEGIDGAGTSTQISLLKDAPFAQRIFATAEPTNAETGKFLRRVLSGEIKLDERTTAFLFAADRAEHIFGREREEFSGGIAEKCARGTICVSDRYLFSSIAYQGVSLGDEFPRFLNSRFPLPELLFFFEIEPEISLSRIKSRGKTEIYEKIDFLKKTQERYKSTVASFENCGMKICRIDAAKSIGEIKNQIWQEIGNLCK